MGDEDRNGRAWPEAAWRVCQCSSHHMDESVKEIDMIVLVLYYIGNLIGNSDSMKQKEGKLEVLVFVVLKKVQRRESNANICIWL